MSRYTPVSTGTSSPTTHTARSSFASIRRPSISSFRFGSSRPQAIPDPEEMDAAFDGPEEDDGDAEQRGLLANSTPERRVPGDYDFERDYVRSLTLSRSHTDPA